MPQSDLPPPLTKASYSGRMLKVCVAILVVVLVIALTVFVIYGVDSHHQSRDSIWWPERGRNLIPPAAIDITLQRDLLDHYATYTVSEKDLNSFLDERFARDGETLDSFSTRSRINPTDVGRAIGRLGWVATESTVLYSFSASNGGGHAYYHDPNTGSTYQDSAYW
jgi:hypothetical protein